MGTAGKKPFSLNPLTPCAAMNPLQTVSDSEREICYPDSDGLPMADNTVQFRWIVTIHSGLDALFRDDPAVFVAGDLLWYPVRGEPKVRVAPDVMVAVGRPKGDRGSYRQWEEQNIAPQVVFEILSPGNRAAALAEKHGFYERHGVEEYYVYDPEEHDLLGFVRGRDGLEEVAQMDGWVSPRLGIRFFWRNHEFVLFKPDGTPFRTALEEIERADEAVQREEQAVQREEQAVQRAERLAAQLRALGVEPEH